MRPLYVLMTMLIYGASIYYLTQHTQQSAILMGAVCGVGVVIGVVMSLAGFEPDQGRFRFVAGILWWVGYVAAWLMGWPSPSSEMLIASAVALALAFIVAHIDWLLP